MATVTQVKLTCDVCGDTNEVKTRTFGLDGKAYEIDLCRKDGNALGRVAARYIAKARKVTAKRRRRQHGGRPQQEAKPSRSGQQAATVSGATARATGSRKAAKASRSQEQNAEGSSTAAAEAAGVQQKGIYVYGILPADIEVAVGIPGVGEHPGLLRDVRFDGLAALISEVDSSARLGSPDDLRAHQEILDATAAEVPVVPLRFGTILPSEDAVAEDLLAARRDEFTAALDELDGRIEFQVKGRYVKDAVVGEVLSQNKQAAGLREAIQGNDPDAARKARIELGQLLNQAVKARREEDTRALRQAMERLCVASVAREPAHELDAVHVAFLVAVDQEPEVERVIEDLAHEWEGRIDVQLLGPMAAYDFTGSVQSES
jgi:Gas vesicle synthesis protein GvpL/GvpF/Lsr2